MRIIVLVHGRGIRRKLGGKQGRTASLSKRPLFKKSGTKNLCYAGPWALAALQPVTQRSKSLFASFSSEKEALACL
jgi:hypothetical protein